MTTDDRDDLLLNVDYVIVGGVAALHGSSPLTISMFAIAESPITSSGLFMTPCAFLNAGGGAVIVGVTDNGTIAGQEVSDKTQREIAAMLDRFEPPALVEVQFVGLPNSSDGSSLFSKLGRRATAPFHIRGRS